MSKKDVFEFRNYEKNFGPGWERTKSWEQSLEISEFGFDVRVETELDKILRYGSIGGRAL